MNLEILSRTTLLILMISMLTGCQGLFKTFLRQDPQLPIVFETPPTLEALTASINENTARTKHIQSKVEVNLDGQPKLTGELAFQQPQNLRIKAGVLGIAELGVDMGSNDEVFWVWSKASVGGMEPLLLYARHDEFAASDVARTLPIQPQWIVQAMGLVTFDAADQHDGPFPQSDGLVEIRSQMESPRGKIVRVVVVDPKRGTIQRVSLYDSQNQLIAYSNASRYQFDTEQNVKLPRHVDIFFRDPAGQRVKLSISAPKYTINQFWGDPEKLWQMPRPADVQMIDISNPSFSPPDSTSPTIDPPLGSQSSGSAGVQAANPPRGYRYR